ncbi:MAG: alpha/beta fold hydrolase [Paracoccus sp. (in: a-proteobacteria)]|nr:alpha/beta fold hydrolase [Paracoccus sp. (in: a-proteobacteria)]
MKLNHTTLGQPSGVPVILVHGLFGQGRNLGAQARRLSQSRQVISPDLRNHGDSPHDADSSYQALAADLAELIVDYGGQADLVGHSMGGKAAMVLALIRPQLVRKLGVLDIAPLPYSHDQTANVDAMQRLDVSGLTRRSEADRALADYIDDPRTRAFFLQSLDLKSEPPRWRLNLPALRANMPAILGWPDGIAKGAFTGPVLGLRGARSNYVTAEGEAALRDHFPQARLVTINGAGHWLHADAPEAVADTLAAFLGDG